LKPRIPFLIFAAFILSTAVYAQHASGRDAILARGGWIKVLLRHDLDNLNVRLPSGFRILSAGGETFASAVAGSLDVTAVTGKIEVKSGGKSVASAKVLVVEPETPAYKGYFITPFGRYRGRLVLTAHRNSFSAINQVQIDDWLKGVLAAEMGDSNIEALKAQAVAGRSEAIHKLAHPPHADEGYDFCNGVHCQAYKGMAEENEHFIQACNETVGMVLMTGGNNVLDAVYHDLCGGVTAGAEDVWESDPIPGLSPILDSRTLQAPGDLSSNSALAQFLSISPEHFFCNPAQPGYFNYERKYFRWQKSYTGDQLQRIAGVGRIRDVSVTERRPSGRVRKLTITGDSGSRTIVKELPIRNMFDLWSGLFYLEVSKKAGYVDQVIFKGGGHGHGVGLCQQGARMMAAQGITFDKILAHYYRGATLQRIYRP
jgi:SpoIID/LytB domain protein